MNRKYYKAEIAFDKKNYEVIYNTIYLTGFSTILEDNGTVQIFVTEDEKDKLKLLKEELVEDNAIREQDFIIEEFKDRDWNNEWKESIDPIYIKDKLVVTPSWKLAAIKEPENKVIIQIDPKMAFGTGHNETTQMILDIMVDCIDEKDKYMLDYGTGTGVLAIAGIKLGVEKAIAIDNDIDSIFSAEENTANNNAADNITLYKANISDIKEKDFDIIIANIDRTVITENMMHLKDKLKRGGKLIITGILHEENDELTKAIKDSGFKLIETREKAEWLAYYAIKKK
ncbi:MAG: 50S ribosomal protein L11 methyltransferase [Ignavibacteriae bacterium]|nr:MAG: 50S ribosomal protein L11 methyltransferase [Ignavibacteriota bacterium]